MKMFSILNNQPCYDNRNWDAKFKTNHFLMLVNKYKVHVRDAEFATKLLNSLDFKSDFCENDFIIRKENQQRLFCTGATHIVSWRPPFQDHLITEMLCVCVCAVWIPVQTTPPLFILHENGGIADTLANVLTHVWPGVSNWMYLRCTVDLKPLSACVIVVLLFFSLDSFETLPSSRSVLQTGFMTLRQTSCAIPWKFLSSYLPLSSFLSLLLRHTV